MKSAIQNPLHGGGKTRLLFSRVTARKEMDYRSAIGAILMAILSAPVGMSISYADPVETPACAKYDAYNVKGSEVPYPSNCDSLTPELGGLRPILYENGWNFQAVVRNGVNYDVLRHEDGKQIYGGQKPTYSGSVAALLTYDLGRMGLPEGSQFALGGGYTYTSFEGGGITDPLISQLSVLFPLYDDRLVVQAGYYSVPNQFYGFVIGNNTAASVLGPQSTILLGLGAGGFKPTPAIDVRMYSADKRFYNHFGISRSVSPEGFFVDSDHNPSGLSFSTPGAKALFIDEVGFRVEAGPDQKKIWLRAGAVYNTSQYTRLDDPTEKSSNLGFYAVGDFQLTQPNASLPYQGWYINGRVDWGREDINAFAYDFGVTLYRLGTFESRPYDAFSVGVQRSFFSRYARDTAEDAGLSPAEASTVYTTSYTFRIGAGKYLQSALSYTDNPTFAPKRDGALDANLSLSLVF
jgi:porin